MKKLLLILLFVPLVSFGQRSNTLANLNSFKYIVIEDVPNKKIRKEVVKQLSKNGYNVVNIQKTARTHNEIPIEIQEDPSLAMYLYVELDCPYLCTSFILIYDSDGSLIYKHNATKIGFPDGLAPTKKALKSLTEFSYKYLPGSKFKKKSIKNVEWAGNGSGIIISKSGHIITNHHVIEDADDIEVEFILNDEVQKFNAEVVQVDKTNDLAIIKIDDMNFDGIDEPPYNFKTISSDVGTRVYAFGYPMALTVMGKEIKVTDGIISSKTGFDGNITTYQITAPIQGGNSGGPLFDEKGNLIGINSSGIQKYLADNVGYSIKTSYILNLIDILPKSIELPSNTKLESLPLTEQIREISKYVVLIKVK